MKFMRLLFVFTAVGLLGSFSIRADEHPGQEHGGTPVEEKKQEKKEEVKDEEKAKELPSQEQGGAPVEKKKEEEEMKKGEEKKQPLEEEELKEADEAGADSAKVYNANEIKQAMTAHINAETKEGVFSIHDPKTHEELKLKFVKIHDPVRVIKGKGYFACTDFEVVGEKGKLYDLDFWLNPKNSKLSVTETKIHKEPKLENGKWTKAARYTFDNDNPVAVQ